MLMVSFLLYISSTSPPPPTWCAPWHWPPRQAPPPSYPCCPPWAVSRKSQEKCAKKRRKKLGVAVVPLAIVFFGGWEMSELGGGKCLNFGGGKCPPGKWPTPADSIQKILTKWRRPFDILDCKDNLGMIFPSAISFYLQSLALLAKLSFQNLPWAILILPFWSEGF